ncbi:MAG: ice-binding family protein [Ginsengibacter sp.]
MKKMLLSLVTFVTLSFHQSITFAQAPDLGTAVNFVLFSSNGAVNNTGALAQLTGDVGTNNGAMGGFGNVNGVMHNADGATAQCALDLQAAYNTLNATVANFFPVSSSLGNGDTLIAGVYAIPGAATLSSNLYLDAKGDANAVFIFKMPAAFSIDPLSKIKLLNGAQACNIFWKAEGLVSMASGAFMRGTIIANNAAIDMNVNDTLEGRALSTAGAVTVSGVLAYTPTGCGSVLLTGPEAPNLGTAACYSIFSGNGSVINSGISYAKGDIGTNVGLTTGYNPLYVTGMIHPIPDGSTAACVADLLNAYNFLNNPSYDIELLYPAQFGHNLVLTPHTYLLNAATSFTDTLYLDAQGYADAVFIIKINGALSTSTFSKVILMNGTKSSNVYWKVEGAVTINDYSVFNGTIICNNAAINLNTGDSINGRTLTTNGAVSTAAVTVIIPDGTCAILPVSWIYFRGKPVAKNVLLEWSTTNEINNGFFTIEKSHDGVSFEKLTTVNAGTINNNSERFYSATDQQPYSLGYYRISQTDKDGRKNYFRTIQVKANIANGLKVFQYAEENYLYVKTSNATPGNGLIEVYSTDGKKVLSQKIALTEEVSTFKSGKQLQTGMYIINILNAKEKIYSGKIMIR